MSSSARKRRIVLRVSINCPRCKVVVQRAVAEFEGVDSATWDINMRTITVVGDVSPEQLRREIWINGKTARIIEVETLQPGGNARTQQTRNGENSGAGHEQRGRGDHAILLSAFCRECELQMYVPCHGRYCSIL